jgi:PAS domain S-box-containing protein
MSIDMKGRAVRERTKDLAGSREYLRITLQSIGDAVIATDARGVVTWMNPVAEALTGWTQEEARGEKLEKVFRIVNAQTRQPQENPVAIVLREGRTIGLANHTALVDRGGKERQIADSAAPIRDKDGLMAGVVLVFRDVTDHDEKDRLLRESETRFRTLFESMREGVALHELVRDQNGIPVDYRITEVNPAYEAHTGLAASGVKGALASSIYGGASPPYLDLYTEVATTGQPRSFETYYPPMDRHYRIAVSSPGKDLFATIFEDVTERKRAEEVLRESEKRYRSLFENMLEGYAFCRMLFENGEPRDFIYLDVNGAFETLTGLREVVGKRVTQVIPGIRESNPELFEIYGRVALTGMPEKLEIYLERLGIWFSIAVYSPIREHFVAVFDNITGRKRAEEALRESEARLRLAMDAAKAGAWEWDLRTYENVWSEELYKVYGLEPGSCKPSYEAWRQIVHPGDRPRAEQTVREAASRGTDLNVEFRVVDRDGTERWLMSRGRPLRDGNGKIVRYIGIVLDITERRRAEEALRSSLEEKTALLREVHHRVKNNLQIVASLLNLQASRIRNRQVLETLHDTQSRVRSMALLHEALYRSDNLAKLDFSAYVDQLCGHVSRSFGAEAGRVKLTVSVADVNLGIDQAIPCGLIINELVTNAFKHAFPKGRAGQVAVALEHGPEGRIVLSVGDNGVGLPPEMDDGHTDTLGLKIVGNLARQLSGNVDVIRGKGTLYRVLFPAKSEV